MPHCQELRQKINKISEECSIEEMKQTLKKFKETGDNRELKNLKQKILTIREEVEGFKVEFLKKIEEILKGWFPKYPQEKILQKINIEKGKVIITENIVLMKSDIQYFPKMIEIIRGSLRLNGSNIQKLGSLKKVDGYLDLSDSDIKDLGSLEEVGSGLDLSSTDLRNLGPLKKVGSELNLEGSNVESLGQLKSVGWSLDLRHTHVKDLEHLEKVGHNLRLEDTGIEKLPDSLEIWGDIFIDDKEPIKSEAKQAKANGRVRHEVKINN